MNGVTVVNATIYNEDCIEGMLNRLEPGSVDLTVTSPPFEELFTYSGKTEDVGNNGSTVDLRAGRFALNLHFFRQQLFRVHRPGSLVCLHIQQLLAYVNQHGFMGRRDFRGAMIDIFQFGPDADRFHFVGEFVIPKDPQAMAQRLNLHSLQFKTGYGRDARRLAPAVNDYVLIFQKPGGEDGRKVLSLRHETRNPDGWVDTDEWVRWASGVWDDIDEFDIIDGARSARESTEEKHVCPLQLEVIRRLVRLYTSPAYVQPDVLVMDPFMGVGSTAAVCVELERNVVGFELKESYYSNALKNVQRARARLEAKEAHGAGLFGRVG